MATNVNNLSPSKLKLLKIGDAITIRYASSQQDLDQNLTRIIYDQFPKRVATAFSTKWATQLSTPISKTTLKDLSKPKDNSVVIVGGSLKVIQQTLNWVLSCCDGKGVQQFHIYPDKPFYHYFIIRQLASHLGIPSLEKQMQSRLNDIATRQIHSEDVRAMYLLLPADSPILKDIAAHVATLMWEKRLKAVGAYRTLREEISQFDADVSAVLNVKAEEWKVEKEARRQTREEERRTKAQLRKAKRDRVVNTRAPIDDVARRYLHVDRSEQTSLQAGPTTLTSPDSDGKSKTTTHHKTIRCTVARKAQKGRPTYVSLPLADVGIKKDEFTSDAFRPVAPKPKKTPPKADPVDKHEKEEKPAGTQSNGFQGLKSKTQASDDLQPGTKQQEGGLLLTPVAVVPNVSRRRSPAQSQITTHPPSPPPPSLTHTYASTSTSTEPTLAGTPPPPPSSSSPLQIPLDDWTVLAVKSALPALKPVVKFPEM